MAKPEFTPGPWGVEKKLLVGHITLVGATMEDAFLIAAAPDMYAELESASCLLLSLGYECTSRAIDRVLAQARGEQ